MEEEPWKVQESRERARASALGRTKSGGCRGGGLEEARVGQVQGEQAGGSHAG